jgi:hypothetical protein
MNSTVAVMSGFDWGGCARFVILDCMVASFNFDRISFSTLSTLARFHCHFILLKSNGIKKNILLGGRSDGPVRPRARDLDR